MSLTVNDVGLVELGLCGVDGDLTGLLHVFIKVPTSVLVKYGEDEAELPIWPHLHAITRVSKTQNKHRAYMSAC